MSRKACVSAAAAALIGGLLVASGQTRVTAFAEDGRVRMTILPLQGSAVIADAQGDTYTDVGWLPDGGDFCVSGEAYPTGLGFMSLNRRLPDGPLCNGESDGNGGFATSRSYSLTIDSGDACSALGFLTAPCTVVPDEDGVTLVRAETVFKNKAKATKVVFLFTTNFTNYRVETSVDAPIIGSPSGKIVTNDRQASLRVVGRTSPIAYFPLPFQLLFERQ